MITNFFIPELNNHDVQELWFQQDGATCHTARATIYLLKDTLGDRLISRFGPVNWPPRSCDLTPLDYFFNKFMGDFPVICYTDCSKMDDRVGFTFVVFRNSIESENFQFRICDECTVFVAELLCFNFAIKWIIEQDNVVSDCFICPDSVSSLDSLTCNSSPNNIINRRDPKTVKEPEN
ncbi:uncharacterized protein TNCV_2265951 [Trichonephila clavipes]|nr:uncharacterized protein TNCV_2265951 [Trichonephila clavipes]